MTSKYTYAMTPCISSIICVIACRSARDSYFHHLYVQICLMKCELQGVNFLGVFCTMYIRRMQNAKLTCELLQSSQKLLFIQGVVAKHSSCISNLRPLNENCNFEVFSTSTRISRFHQFVSYIVDGV